MSEKIYVNHPNTINGYRVVQDTTALVAALAASEACYRYEYGNSLHPIVRSGEYCFIKPYSEFFNEPKIKRGDIVFCLIELLDGTPIYMTHMVINKSRSGYDGTMWYQIGSSNGNIYGWSNKILGIASGTNIFEQEFDPALDFDG